MHLSMLCSLLIFIFCFVSNRPAKDHEHIISINSLPILSNFPPELFLYFAVFWTSIQHTCCLFFVAFTRNFILWKQSFTFVFALFKFTFACLTSQGGDVILYH